MRRLHLLFMPCTLRTGYTHWSFPPYRHADGPPLIILVPSHPAFLGRAGLPKSDADGGQRHSAKKTPNTLIWFCCLLFLYRHPAHFLSLLVAELRFPDYASIYEPLSVLSSIGAPADADGREPGHPSRRVWPAPQPYSPCVISVESKRPAVRRSPEPTWLSPPA